MIVRQFGGDLWVSSTPGSGATFSFTIPLAEAARKEEVVEWRSAS
jgi:signal transduction histidine kinase